MSVNTGIHTGRAVYEDLADRIRRLILTGTYQPGELIGSEHGLARAERLSRVTVRRASELLVNEGLLERRPGKGLYVRRGAGADGGIIQVVAGNLLWEPALQLSRGVRMRASDQQIQVQLYDAQGDMQLDLGMIAQLPGSGARGAVILSLHSPQFSEAICRLHLQGFPFVLLDHRMRDLDITSVTADNHSGGYLAGELLVRHSHHRIAFIGDVMATTVQDRLTGCRDALADAGLALPRSAVVDLPVAQDRLGDWSACIAHAARDLLLRPQRPTAVVCSCDAIARQVYATAAELGLEIPRDLSVVGFDDDPLAEWLSPQLTTLRQPFLEMGQVAMELLLDRIAEPAAPAAHRVLPVQLIQRASVAAPGDMSGD